jgi:hypothetical protein
MMVSVVLLCGGILQSQFNPYIRHEGSTTTDPFNTLESVSLNSLAILLSLGVTMHSCNEAKAKAAGEGRDYDYLQTRLNLVGAASIMLLAGLLLTYIYCFYRYREVTKKAKRRSVVDTNTGTIEYVTSNVIMTGVRGKIAPAPEPGIEVLTTKKENSIE